MAQSAGKKMLKHGKENGILRLMKMRTIIVDNDPELLEQLKTILKEEKEAELVAAFSHPGDLLAFARENQVDLVFSDVVMPEISGITLAGELAGLEHPPKVILMSDIPGLSLKTWKIKALAFMPKPYTRKTVREMLELAQKSS